MEKDSNKLTRVEVISGLGREYVNWLGKGYEFELSWQDDGKTLKLFVIESEDKGDK